jgi:hypothetical protein
MPQNGKILCIAAAVFFVVVLPAWAAVAETLDLTCTQMDGSKPRRVKIDLTVGLVSNSAGYDSRNWAAHVSDSVITWDEIFDWHISHFSNHYVFNRVTGKLNGTSLGMGGGIHEILDVICQKNP